MANGSSPKNGVIHSCFGLNPIAETRAPKTTKIIVLHAPTLMLNPDHSTSHFGQSYIKMLRYNVYVKYFLTF